MDSMQGRAWHKLALCSLLIVLLAAGCAGGVPAPTAPPADIPTKSTAEPTAGEATPAAGEATGETGTAAEPTPEPSPTPDPGWQQMALGAALNADAAGSAEAHAMAVGPDNLPVVAWIENGQLLVKKWDGSAWKQLGARLNRATETPDTPAVAVEKDGSPVVVWTESEEGSTLYAARWNGSAWAQLGGKLNGQAETEAAHDPQLVATAQGPVLAWLEGYDESAQVAVRRWDGSAWQPLGDTAGWKVDSSAVVEALALTALPDGSPAVAWKETSSSPAVHVKVWDGAKKAWASAPEPASEADSVLVGFGAAKDAALYLSLGGDSGLKPVQRWAAKDKAWAAVGTLDKALEASPDVYGARMAVGADGAVALVIPAAAGDVQAWRSDGKAWAYLEAVNPAEAPGEAPAVGVATDGTIYVAWRDLSGEATQLLVVALKPR